MNNAAKKKSKTDVTLKWDEEIGSDDDESHDKFPDEQADSEDEEETAEQARKR